jgi:transposase
MWYYLSSFLLTLIRQGEENFMSTSLLYHCFGLQGVRYQATRYQGGKTIFEAEITKKLILCSKCNSRKVTKEGSKVRLLKMPPIAFKPTLLRLKIYRIKCKKCKAICWPKLPFAKPKKRYTNSFARLATELILMMTIKDCASFLGVGWDTIKNIHKEHLSNRYRIIPLKELEYIGIDEFAIRKGHHYMTIAIDLARGAVLFATEGKSGESITPFLKKLKRKSKKLKAISIDMNKGYIAAILEHLPKIDIVFDHYHISALMNRGLDELRRKHQKDLDEIGKKTLKGSRYLLLSNYESLNQEKQDRLQALLEINAPLATMHCLKEQFREFWNQTSSENARKFFDNWYEDAMKSKIHPLMKVAKTLRSYLFGLVNYFKHKITSASVEGTNNKIKTLIRQVYGFRDMEYFKLRLFHLHQQTYSLAG